MEINRAKELLTILADGINPITGELLPDEDSCNQVEIVRALHSVIMELDNKNKTPTKNTEKIPVNHGQRKKKNSLLRNIMRD